MVEAILSELSTRSNYLGSNEVQTIYFGGGTPSILNYQELSQILYEINSKFKVHPRAEITLECNPDDLIENKTQELFDLGVNRLSIGVQSFDDKVLKFMNRAHSSQDAIESILKAHEVGFKNITADLIYGIPEMTITQWQEQLKQMIALPVQHISAYCLTIESKTVFGALKEQGKLYLPEDEMSLAQFQLMVETLMKNGFEQYEISNFAKDGFQSKHNSSYWLGHSYLGIGPSAHSYNGISREWNISNNPKYIRAIEQGESVNEVEILTERDRINDYILTRLRTIWGIDLNELQLLKGTQSLLEFESEVSKHVQANNLIQNEHIITLSEQGKFIADKIASDLFV